MFAISELENNYRPQWGTLHHMHGMASTHAHIYPQLPLYEYNKRWLALDNIHLHHLGHLIEYDVAKNKRNKEATFPFRLFELENRPSQLMEFSRI